MSQMPTWRFYQGLRNEWRWYKLGHTGSIIAGSDRACAELEACMANAEHAGFNRGGSFQVHARSVADVKRPSSAPDYLAADVHSSVMHAP